MLLAAPVYAEVLLEDMIHIFPSFIYLELSYKMIRNPYKNSKGTIAIIYCLSIFASTMRYNLAQYHLMVISMCIRKFYLL